MTAEPSHTANIMVVDDDRVVTQTIGSFLALETDYRVRVFLSPVDALAALDEAPADVVISDFLMPQMNGLEFLAQVKERYPDVVRILLTGYADKENAIHAINNVGIFQYVEKPWDNDQLILVIKNALANRRLETQLKAKIQELDATLRERDHIAARHDSLREELMLARRVQEMLLPRAFPPAGDIRFVARYEPALEVGGDFYDVVPLSGDAVAMIVADATGHGISAALCTTLMKSAFAEFAHRDIDDASPERILRNMNQAIFRALPTEMFVAATVATIDGRSGVARIAGGGGPSALRVDGNGSVVDAVHSHGLLLGVVGEDTYAPGKAAEISLGAGDGLWLYSDGLSEVENEEGSEFGTARLREAFGTLLNNPADLEAACDDLIAGVKQFARANHQWDDITLLGAHRAQT